MITKLKNDVIEIARCLLEDVPDKVAPALAAETDPAKCEAIIMAALVEALDGLEDAALGRSH